MSVNHVIYTKQNMQYRKVQGHKCSSVFKNLVDIYKYKYTMLELFHCGTLLPSPPEGANCLQCRSTTCRRRLRKSWWCWDRDWMRHWSRRGEPCIVDWLRRGGSSYLTWWAKVDIHRSLHLFIVTDVKNMFCKVFPFEKWNPFFCLVQVTVHKQRQKDLSNMCKGLEGGIEVGQHLHCWQNLLTAHSLELAELINNLDEEAAADIRKVPHSDFTSLCVSIFSCETWSCINMKWGWSHTCSLGHHACDPGCHSRHQSHPAFCSSGCISPLASRRARLSTADGTRARIRTGSECSPGGTGKTAPGRQGSLAYPQLHQGGSEGRHGERATGAEGT